MNQLATRLPVIPRGTARGMYLFVCGFSLVVWLVGMDAWFAGAEWIAMTCLWLAPWNPYEAEEG